MGRAWYIVGLAVAAACSRMPESDGRAETRQASGDEAALVNGSSIAIGEVAALAEATGLTPRQSLERLIAARLLAQRAQELGFASWPEVRRGVARARVQLLLARAVESGSSPGDVAERKSKLEALLEALARRSPAEYREAAIEELLGTL